MNIKYPIKHYSSIIVELVLLDILCKTLHKIFLYYDSFTASSYANYVN